MEIRFRHGFQLAAAMGDRGIGDVGKYLPCARFAAAIDESGVEHSRLRFASISVLTLHQLPQVLYRETKSSLDFFIAQIFE